MMWPTFVSTGEVISPLYVLPTIANVAVGARSYSIVQFRMIGNSFQLTGCKSSSSADGIVKSTEPIPPANAISRFSNSVIGVPGTWFTVPAPVTPGVQILTLILRPIPGATKSASTWRAVYFEIVADGSSVLVSTRNGIIARLGIWRSDMESNWKKSDEAVPICRCVWYGGWSWNDIRFDGPIVKSLSSVVVPTLKSADLTAI